MADSSADSCGTPTSQADSLIVEVCASSPPKSSVFDDPGAAMRSNSVSPEPEAVAPDVGAATAAGTSIERKVANRGLPVLAAAAQHVSATSPLPAAEPRPSEPTTDGDNSPPRRGSNSKASAPATGLQVGDEVGFWWSKGQMDAGNAPTRGVLLGRGRYPSYWRIRTASGGAADISRCYIQRLADHMLQQATGQASGGAGSGASARSAQPLRRGSRVRRSVDNAAAASAAAAAAAQRPEVVLGKRPSAASRHGKAASKTSATSRLKRGDSTSDSAFEAAASESEDDASGSGKKKRTAGSASTNTKMAASGGSKAAAERSSAQSSGESSQSEESDGGNEIRSRKTKKSEGGRKPVAAAAPSNRSKLSSSTGSRKARSTQAAAAAAAATGVAGKKLRHSKARAADSTGGASDAVGRSGEGGSSSGGATVSNMQEAGFAMRSDVAQLSSQVEALVAMVAQMREQRHGVPSPGPGPQAWHGSDPPGSWPASQSAAAPSAATAPPLPPLQSYGYAPPPPMQPWTYPTSHPAYYQHSATWGPPPQFAPPLQPPSQPPSSMVLPQAPAAAAAQASLPPPPQGAPAGSSAQAGQWVFIPLGETQPRPPQPPGASG